MSDLATMRSLLETAAVAVEPLFPTSLPGKPLLPSPTVAYQEINILWAEPEHGENTGVFRQAGFMQVTLRYPLGEGPGAAEAKAEAFRSAFWRNRTLQAGAVRVQIERAGAIDVLPNEDGRLVRAIRIRFYANDLTS